MSNNKRLPTDPDMLGSMQAIKCAANRARQIAEATNTPCYVMKDGKVVDIARKQAPSKWTRSLSGFGVQVMTSHRLRHHGEAHYCP